MAEAGEAETDEEVLMDLLVAFKPFFDKWRFDQPDSALTWGHARFVQACRLAGLGVTKAADGTPRTFHAIYSEVATKMKTTLADAGKKIEKNKPRPWTKVEARKVAFHHAFVDGSAADEAASLERTAALRERAETLALGFVHSLDSPPTEPPPRPKDPLPTHPPPAPSPTMPLLHLEGHPQGLGRGYDVAGRKRQSPVPGASQPTAFGSPQPDTAAHRSSASAGASALPGDGQPSACRQSLPPTEPPDRPSTSDAKSPLPPPPAASPPVLHKARGRGVPKRAEKSSVPGFRQPASSGTLKPLSTAHLHSASTGASEDAAAGPSSPSHQSCPPWPPEDSADQPLTLDKFNRRLALVEARLELRIGQVVLDTVSRALEAWSGSSAGGGRGGPSPGRDEEGRGGAEDQPLRPPSLSLSEAARIADQFGPELDIIAATSRLSSSSSSDPEPQSKQSRRPTNE